MPIRESERHRYPANWREIRAATLDRAGDRCECDGRCGSDKCGTMLIGFAPTRRFRHRCMALNGHPQPLTGSLVVLTIAHLDHTPEHCDPDNLLALCQACHLSYDREHHAETRRRSRRGARCRAGCVTRDHATWGDCARAARIGIDRTALAEGRK